MTKKPHGMEFFERIDGVGTSFDEMVTAVSIMAALRQPLSVRDAALAFNVTEDVIENAVDQDYFLWLRWPAENESIRIIELDGEG